MNHFPLVLGEMVDLGAPKAGYVADIAAMRQTWGLPFVRTAFGWFNYQTWKTNYLQNKALYYGVIDAIVAECESKGLGIIANVCWSPMGFSQLTYDLYGVTSPPSDYGRPNSTLWDMLRAFINEFVGRYKNSPAILAWQFGNEVSSSLGNEFFASWKTDGTGTDSGGNALPSHLNFGTKPEGGNYAPQDKLSQAGYLRFTRALVDAFHTTDPHARMVISGNAGGNAFAVNARNANTLTADTLAQWSGVSQTEFMPWAAYRDRDFGCVTNHLYPLSAKVGDGQYFADGDLTYAQHITLSKQWADQVGKPFFLEEWGATRYGSGVDPISTDLASETANFTAALNAMQANNVQLSAVWNWGGKIDGAIEWMRWDLSHPSRTYQLAAIQAANASLA